MVVINCGNDSGSGGGSDDTVIHSSHGDNRGDDNCSHGDREEGGGKHGISLYRIYQDSA